VLYGWVSLFTLEYSGWVAYTKTHQKGPWWRVRRSPNLLRKVGTITFPCEGSEERCWKHEWPTERERERERERESESHSKIGIKYKTNGSMCLYLVESVKNIPCVVLSLQWLSLVWHVWETHKKSRIIKVSSSHSYDKWSKVVV
jgi:hypothetical protein